MEKELIACCGVDCGACSDYAKEVCPGCRASAHTALEDCMPVACCEEKNIDFCSGCGQFPCEEMQAFFAESDSHWEAFERLKDMRG